MQVFSKWRFLGIFSLYVLSSCGQGSAQIASGKVTPNDSQELLESDIFKATVYPIVRKNCATCHSSLNSPKFASPDYLEAYEAVSSRRLVDLVDPAASRFVSRMNQDRHNCGSDCESLATEFKAKIQTWKFLLDDP